MRNIFVISLALLLGTSLTLIAQETLLPSSKTVIIAVDGVQRQVTTTAATVQELLAQEGIELIQHDRTEPAGTAFITDGLKLTITRVRMEIRTERVPIAPPVKVQANRRVRIPVVLDPGKPGVAEQKHIIWTKDGVVTVQWTQGRKVVTAPKPKLVIRGSGNQTSRSGYQGRRSFIVSASAYEPGPRSCGRYADGYTAIGLPARKGVIAVDPRVIPLGTRVHVEGYGPAIAADTGGAIKGHRIDVCYPTVRECLQWGRRKVRVTILE